MHKLQIYFVGPKLYNLAILVILLYMAVFS